MHAGQAFSLLNRTITVLEKSCQSGQDYRNPPNPEKSTASSNWAVKVPLDGRLTKLHAVKFPPAALLPATGRSLFSIDKVAVTRY